MELARRAKGEPGFTLAEGIEEIRKRPKPKADPLAPLVRLEKAIEKIELEQVDTERLQQLLSDIVAKANALLKRLEQ